MSFTGKKSITKTIAMSPRRELLRRPLVAALAVAALTAWTGGTAIAGPIDSSNKDAPLLLDVSSLSDGELANQRGVGDTGSIADPSRSDRQLAVILWDDFKNKKPGNSGVSGTGTIQLNVTVNGNR